MVSDNVKIDLQGTTRTYLQVKPNREDYPEALKTIVGLVDTREHYPSYLVYQEGAEDIHKPLVLIEYDGITIEEAYEEVRGLLSEDCKFGQVKIVFPSSY